MKLCFCLTFLLRLSDRVCLWVCVPVCSHLFIKGLLGVRGLKRQITSPFYFCFISVLQRHSFCHPSIHLSLSLLQLCKVPKCCCSNEALLNVSHFVSVCVFLSCRSHFSCLVVSVRVGVKLFALPADESE